jgi:hypothetical protein
MDLHFLPEPARHSKTASLAIVNPNSPCVSVFSTTYTLATVPLLTMRFLLGLFLLLFSCPAWSQFDPRQSPTLSGHLTRVASACDFDVNGIRILCGPQTLWPYAGVIENGCPQTPPVLGQSLEVYGKRKNDTIAAERIDLEPLHRGDIAGSALIDAGPIPNSAIPGALEIRADGYRLLLTSQSRLSFHAPLRGKQDVMTNLWIKYDAKPGPDGAFVLKSARFSQNLVTKKQEKLQTRTNYDPAAIPPDAKTNKVAAVTGFGIDPKRIPPWPDEDEQKRLETIGRKLVPAWMGNLAPNDPTRIDFRFQLTDGKQWPLLLALPSGVILVPHEIVERMQNDSQLAEILADGVAIVLEGQTGRVQIASTATTFNAIGNWLQLAEGVPGLASFGAGQVMSGVAITKLEHQSGRVSLSLMHDAGYDVDEAPKAWWRLASKTPKPLASIALPERSGYLYQVLAEDWTAPPSRP